MIVLALDASTYVGTAALFDGDRVLASGETPMRGRDAERLFPLLLDVLRQGGVELRGLGEIHCGAGPGSFTSLRIAASLAKGLAAGLGIPIRPLSSLGLVAATAPEEGTYLAALDALRGEYYAQPFMVQGSRVVATGDAVLIAASDLEARSRELRAMLVGPELNGWAPHARGAPKLERGPVADLAAWEPDYGRKAEAQARWEATHGRPLPT